MTTTRPSSTMAAIGSLKKLILRGCCLLAGLLLWSGCANRIFYQPSRRMAPTPDTRDITFEELSFTASDGVLLSAWWLPAQNPKGTILHFHGNAQNMSTHVQYVEWLPAQGYNVFVFDYRGYGKSHGVPDRKGLIRDGMAALKAVSQQPGVSELPLYVWAQSLGGTVGLQAMARSSVPVNAAIIDSTFSSYGKITSDKLKQFPWYLQPLRLFRPALVSSSYNAQDALPLLQDLPILFMHGQNDPVIPDSHSQALHKLAPDNSSLWIIPEAGHCDAIFRYPEQIQPKIIEFFEASAPDKLKP
ncbi:alpha/beta hydrolase [Kiritimatiellota bacterium B12222]|nr:alpha/beta hydrolase [Kiritimatiellota bacterium B12222]